MDVMGTLEVSPFGRKVERACFCTWSKTTKYCKTQGSETQSQHAETAKIITNVGLCWNVGRR